MMEFAIKFNFSEISGRGAAAPQPPHKYASDEF